MWPLPRILGLSFVLVSIIPVSAQMQGAWSRDVGSVDDYSGLNAKLVLDAAGNSAVAANTRGVLQTKKYSSAGTELWRDDYSGSLFGAPTLTGNEQGGLWAATELKSAQESLPSAIVILHYDQSGNRLWEGHFERTNVLDYPIFSLAGDAEENAFLAVNDSFQSQSGVRYRQILTVKYDGAGKQKWSARFETSQYLTLTAVAGDGQGGAVVAGQIVRIDGTGVDFLALKYNSDGALQWSSRTNWGQSDNYASALRVDADGNIYIAGRSGEEFASVKYAPDGNMLWFVRRPSPWFSMASSVGVDDAGRTIVGGFESHNVCFDKDHDDCMTYEAALIVSFDSNGSEFWSTHARSSGKFAVAPSGETYSGALISVSNQTLIELSKYSARGVRIWQTDYPARSLLDLEADNDGNLIVYQTSTNSPTTDERFIRKYVSVVNAATPDVLITPGVVVTNAGAKVTLTAAVPGAEPFTYQWRFFDPVILDNKVVGTNSSLVLTNIQLKQSGYYSVHVVNSSTDVTSPEAHVIVQVAPSATGNPQTTRTRPGVSLRLNAGTMNGSDLAFQWLQNGIPIPAATNLLLNLLSPAASDGGVYELVISNQLGIAKSAPISLQILTPGPLDTWQWLHPRPQGNDLTGGAWGKGRYVLVGAKGVSMTSANALNWDVRQEERFGSFSGVTFGAGIFVAMTSNQIFTSPDGITWTARAAVGGDNAAYGNGVFVVNGGTHYVTSSDGITWLDHVSNSPYWGNEIAFGGAKFVRLRTYIWQVLVSDNGSEWISVNLPPPESLTSGGPENLTYGNGLFLATRGNQTAVSTNGLDWIQGPAQPTFVFLDSAAGAGTFVAVGETGTGSDVERTRIFNSNDGLNWRTNSLVLSNNLKTVFFAGDLFIAAGDDGNLLSSRDGEHWNSLSHASDNDFRALAVGAGKFIASGEEGLLYFSEDGENWVQQETVLTNTIKKLVYGNGTLVALTSAGVYASTNRTTWQFTHAYAAELTFVNGLFVLLGQGSLFVSTDAIDWTSNVVPGSALLHSLAYGDGLYALIGSTLTGDSILTSTNLLNWELRTNFSGSSFPHLAWGNGQFVGLGSEAIHSSDGVLWTKTPGLNGLAVDDMIFGGGYFVACGPDGRIFSSADGETWSEHFSASQNRLRSLLYHEGAFWAAGNNEAIVRSAQLIPFLSAETIGDKLQLRVRIEPGRQGRVEVSNDLREWSPLLEFEAAAYSTNIPDSGVTANSARFYRAVLLP